MGNNLDGYTNPGAQYPRPNPPPGYRGPAQPFPATPTFVRDMNQKKRGADGYLEDEASGTLNENILIDLFRKKLINEEQLRAKLKELGRGSTADAALDGKSEIDQMVKLASTKSDISTASMSKALQKGVMTPEQIKSRLDKDFAPEDADFMLQIIQKGAAEEKPGLNISQMANGLKHGLMSEKDIDRRLTELGYDAKDAAVLKGLIQTDTKNQKLSLSAVSDAFKRGDLKEADVMKRLTDVNGYDLSPEDAKLLVTDMKQTTKLGLGPLAELYIDGGLDPTAVKEKLVKEHQYSDKDADLLIQTFQGDKNKAAQQASEKAAAQAERAAKDAEQEAKQKQREKNSRIEKISNENERNPQNHSDNVNGFMENFHQNFLSQLKEAKLGPEATGWLLHNEDAVLNQHIGGGKKGGVLSGSALANIYEGQRGMARKQSQTNVTEIQAKTL